MLRLGNISHKWACYSDGLNAPTQRTYMYIHVIACIMYSSTCTCMYITVMYLDQDFCEFMYIHVHVHIHVGILHDVYC